MKRRDFIIKTSLSGIAITAIPQFTLSQNTNPIELLIGKGNPKLFGSAYKLQEDAHFAFQKMKKAALKDNILIQIVSSYRNFEHQKRIWERKYKRYSSQGLSGEKIIKKIIEYSTIPGTSRHHWGTDIDIIDGHVHPPKNVLRADHFHRDGAFIYLRQWMEEHASTYGFHLVYTNQSNRKGFKYEPWHYSYKPLSKPYLFSYKKLNIKDILLQEKLIGSAFFNEAFMDMYLKENILDINPELL
ncbi:M15 family metallopeptidase [Lacinutrix iliipiscaria]|uniref:M15 family metallopeptidase n=1 Tax=Lacinutrix iliipiscaria TaxID=1230532 RepID=A0ABW5WM41_9FLAO